MKKIYEYGTKFDFNNVKVGDVVVVTQRDYSFSNNRVQWPKRNTFQLCKVSEVGSDYVKVVGCNYKFKQATETTYSDETQREVEFKNYLKISKEVDHIDLCVENAVYYSDEQVEKEYQGIYNPSYLFILDDGWKGRIEKAIQKRIDNETKKKQEEDEKNRVINMKKPYQGAYDSEVNPILEQIEELQDKLEKTRRKAFDTHFCNNCKHNCQGRMCAYEKHWYLNTGNYEINTDNHTITELSSGDVMSSRPTTECKFFEVKD